MASGSGGVERKASIRFLRRSSRSSNHSSSTFNCAITAPKAREPHGSNPCRRLDLDREALGIRNGSGTVVSHCVVHEQVEPGNRNCWGTVLAENLESRKKLLPRAVPEIFPQILFYHSRPARRSCHSGQLLAYVSLWPLAVQSPGFDFFGSAFSSTMSWRMDRISARRSRGVRQPAAPRAREASLA